MADVVETIQSIRNHPAVRISLTVLTVVVVVAFLLYSFPATVGAEESFVVLSGSMEPTINAGDAILVEDVDPADIEEGDVITYQRGGNEVPTTHRVIGVNGTNGSLAFTTQGDANEVPDTQPVSGDEVVGRVMNLNVPMLGVSVYSIPLIGYVIQTVGTSTGFILFFVVPFSLLLASEVWSLAGSVDESDGDPEASGTDETEAVDAADEDDEAYTFTVSELRLALVVLGAFLAYSVYVANELRTVWSIMVSAGILMTGLLIGILYMLGDTVDESEADTTPQEPADTTPQKSAIRTDGRPTIEAGETRLAPGSVPPPDELGTTVHIDSLEALRNMARTDRRWIVNDGNTYAVFGENATYTHVSGEHGSSGEASRDPDTNGPVGVSSLDDVDGQSTDQSTDDGVAADDDSGETAAGDDGESEATDPDDQSPENPTEATNVD